jgi:short-subunit dehydrogenase
MKYRGRAALVTGASSGIGEAFARTLAARGMDVLLSALPEDDRRLRALGAELAERHCVRTELVSIDLAEPNSARRLQAAADDLGFQPDLLVNSAGFGGTGGFTELPLDVQLNMIRVNVEALVALTGLYMPRMVARRDGAVINVASTIAFLPMPYFAVYAASKAFVLSFGEALWAENHRKGVRIVTVCPGPVITRFHQRVGIREPASGAGRLFSRVLLTIFRRPLTAEMVVAAALDGLAEDRPTVVRRVPGARLAYAPVSVATQIVPRRLQLLVLERLRSRVIGFSLVPDAFPEFVTSRFRTGLKEMYTRHRGDQGLI